MGTDPKGHIVKVELFIRTPREIAAFGEFLKVVSAEYLTTTSITQPAQVDEDEVVAAEGVRPEVAAVDAAQVKPTRERGKPSPGHARRTKAEIAEDEAADKADAELKTAGEETGAVVPDKHVEEDSPEVQAADAADEAAETAAAREANGGKLTLDDVRNASNGYVKRFGIPAAQEDVRKLLGKPMVELTADEFGDAVAKLIDAAKTNPYGRPVLEGAPAEVKKADAPAVELPTGATKADVVAAMRRYAKMFDGQDTDASPAAMPIATEDIAWCFSLRFGEDVTKLSQLTPDQYPQAVVDLNSMIEKNPRKRVAVAS